MSTSKASNEQPLFYALHRLARHDRNRAIHALACGLTHLFKNQLQVFVRKSTRLALHLANEWYRRRAIRALHRLDDRVLGDIGLSRGDIEFVVRNGPPWRALRDRPRRNDAGSDVSRQHETA